MILTFKKTFFTLIITLLVSYFFLELFNFKATIINLQKNQVGMTSQIVILTGGTNRIKEGFEIINKFDEKSKKNIKILVSGTGKGFTKLSLQKKLNSNLYLKLIECCVELDGVSKDTYSNANETSKWVNKNNIKEILLITSNYHMPRSILEFNNIMPNLKILPYPIKPEQHQINEWLKSFETFSLVFIEYCKYIVANIRVKIFKV
jgi:hypothetical protein